MSGLTSRNMWLYGGVSVSRTKQEGAVLISYAFLLMRSSYHLLIHVSTAVDVSKTLKELRFLYCTIVYNIRQHRLKTVFNYLSISNYGSY